MKSSVVGALLAGYRLLWPSVAQAGNVPSTTQHSSHEVMHGGDTDPFGVLGLGKTGARKSRLGFELCPGRRESGGEG